VLIPNAKTQKARVASRDGLAPERFLALQQPQPWMTISPQAPEAVSGCSVSEELVAAPIISP